RHGPVWSDETRVVDAVSGQFRPDLLAQHQSDLRVGRTGPELVTDRSFLAGEQAVSGGTIRGDPHPATGAPEGAGDAGEPPDLSGSVDETELLRRGGGVRAGHLLQGPPLVDDADDLGAGEHPVAVPGLVRVQGHELDEPHDTSGAAGEGGEVDDLVVVL